MLVSGLDDVLDLIASDMVSLVGLLKRERRLEVERRP